MGLSSSQARLLNLTSRMHQIEYKAAKLEAEKLQMANKSAKVYEDYLYALDKTKIQCSTIGTDGSINYVDATYNTLIDKGFRLSSSGSIAVSQTDIDFFNTNADKNAVEFACLKSGFAVKNGNYITLANDSTQYLAFDENNLKTLAGEGKNIVLMNNIQISSSLGTLKSTLNGNGHTIKATGSNGIFSSINGGTVKNLNIDANINGYSNVGALANTTSGNVRIENITVGGKIQSTGNTGGLIGNNTGRLTINNISTNVNITSSGSSGGIIGVNDNGKLNISNVSGNVTTNSTGPSGGILGNTWSPEINNISNCNINSNITVTNGVAGGIVGMAWDCIYTDNCYVTGTISSNSNSSYASAGGIYGGWGAGSTKGNGQSGISNCYVDVNLSATSGDSRKMSTSDIGGLIWNTDGTNNLINCASSNGTSSSELYHNNHNLNFVEATNASSVKQNAQNSCNTQYPTTEYNPETSPNYANYLEIGKAIESGNYFLVDGKEDDNEWLTNMINNGSIILEKPDNEGNYFDTSVSTDTNLQEVSDESLVKKAEAKYEADMKKIDNKDRKYDSDLASLETERNAIKQEMETLQTVAKENVERTFRLFS